MKTRPLPMPTSWLVGADLAELTMTFSISWSTMSGRFGWTEIADCVDMEDAVDFFHTHVKGADAPADAEIDTVREV